jgi:hypothetical protein
MGVETRVFRTDTPAGAPFDVTPRLDTITATTPSELLKLENTPEPSVLRIKQRKRGWVPISRALIDDARLQFDTRGVANWLIAKPDCWQIRIGALPHLLQQRAGPGERMGRDRVRRILRELEQAGYLSRSRAKKPDGRWLWRIEFSDTPASLQHENSTMDGSSVDGSTAGGFPADGQGVDIPNTPNNSRFDNSIPTTTPAGDARSDAEVVVAPVIEVRYPPILQREFLASARKLIDRCPLEQRQPVLDEIGAMHARGRVRSPLGLLKSLIDKAEIGQFLPNHSLSVRPMSSRKSTSDGRVQRPLPDANLAPKSPALASEIARKTLSRLREKLQPDGT